MVGTLLQWNVFKAIASLRLQTDQLPSKKLTRMLIAMFLKIFPGHNFFNIYN